MSALNRKCDLSAGFHPSVLVHAAREQAAAFLWLPEALASCKDGEWESPAYVGYVPRIDANQPGAEWQFETTVILLHEDFGMVVIDVLKGDRIGGFELVDRIEG